MTLKTSSFKINKTIFKKTLVRFWPIWVVYTIIMIFILPVQIYTSVRSTVYYGYEDPAEVVVVNKTTDLISVLDNVMHPVLIAVFAIVAAAAVFSYLYGTRSCNMLHAFPVRRGELFATNYISGLLFVVGPQLISYVISLIVCLVLSVPDVRYMGFCILIMMGVSFFFYSMSVFCCMLTGNFFAGFGFYALFNVIYIAVASLFVYLANKICYGFDGSTSDLPGLALSPLFYLYERIGIDYDMLDLVLTEVTISGGGVVAFYCIPAVTFIVVSMLLYRRRHLECAAEITAHRFVKPMLRWMVTILVSMALAYWFTMVFFGDSQLFLRYWVVALIVISWAIFFVLEMIIHKKFKVFKKARFLEWAVCVAVMLIATGMLEGDVLGIEKRIPAADEVEGIGVSARTDMVLMEKEEIERMIQAHQTIIDEKNHYEMMYYDEEQACVYVNLDYYLKDGTHFSRRYYIPESAEYMADRSSAAAQIRSLQEDTNAYLKEWMIANYEGIEIQDGTFYIYSEMGQKETILTKEQAMALHQAMLQDINDNNIACYVGLDTQSTDEKTVYTSAYIELRGTTMEEPIDLYTLREQLYNNETEVVGSRPYAIEIDDGYYDRYEWTDKGYLIPFGFDVQSDCEHTIQALVDLEIIESVDDITVTYEEY